jgi:hypothetical protein
VNRGMNARSMPDRYSIKEVRECIDEIGRLDSDRYSCIDLTSGFWQMELEEESRQSRTDRVIGGLDSSDIFCNSDYKHFLS